MSRAEIAEFETLAKAGVNIRTAERYEELAGGKEKQAQDVAVAVSGVDDHDQCHDSGHIARNAGIESWRVRCQRKT